MSLQLLIVRILPSTKDLNKLSAKMLKKSGGNVSPKSIKASGLHSSLDGGGSLNFNAN